ncbi:hypothetical protein BAE44_0023776 [Dichanthelium oligosanthes]|uniref:DUF4220 domain-containing protein n=1 Tax=Dichanthelium oligosanthes TaxID=888268 RepID=A0A1E5UQW9_9POAL|nr:hypothetical protein BAE44_0023776 [Dichanthelium oligosanthes]
MASVELWVLLTTLMLVIRFLLDFFGPRYANRYMTRIVITIEMVNYSTVHYTMGLMQLSAGRVNDYFQVWAVLLITLQYSVKIGRPYSRSKQIPLLDLMSSFWAANLLRVQTFFLLRIPLWLIWSLNAARIISYFSASDKAEGINQESSRLVADYMSYEHELEGSILSADANNPGMTFTMSGYRYMVLGEDQLLKDVQKGHVIHKDSQRRSRVLRFHPKDYQKLITMDKIWDVDAGKSRLLGRAAGQTNQMNESPQTSRGCLSSFWKNGCPLFAACRPDRLRDVCLSFALYKLLRRRFYDLPVHEDRLPAQRKKIRRLVFKYILQDAETAFRVVATELSFLQDLFYSKHGAMFANGFPILTMVLSLLLVAATGYIAYPIRYIPERMDKTDQNRITHGVFITRVILILIVSKELAEIYIYVFSQWTKVLMLCNYAKRRCMRHWLVEAVIRVLLCFMNRGRWNEKIRQHNMLISSRRWKLGNITTAGLSNFPTAIKLEDCTKNAIFDAIKRLDQDPERLGSYLSNSFGAGEVHEKFQSVLGLKAYTHKILVWHIATCLCEMDLASDKKAAELRPARLPPRPFLKKSDCPSPSTGDEAAVSWNWEHYTTAVSLSNYCAYLVTQALVPDNGLVCSKVFFEVRWEINRVILDNSRSMKEVLTRLKRLVKTLDEDEQAAAQVEPDEEAPVEQLEPPAKSLKKDDDGLSKSLTMLGVRLGNDLINGFKVKAELWEKLADFWTGFLLHLAASTKASKHRARLAGSRELTTHLWALLSHAGFVSSADHGHISLDPEELQDMNPLS